MVEARLQLSDTFPLSHHRPPQQLLHSRPPPHTIPQDTAGGSAEIPMTAGGMPPLPLRSLPLSSCERKLTSASRSSLNTMVPSPPFSGRRVSFSTEENYQQRIQQHPQDQGGGSTGAFQSRFTPPSAAADEGSARHETTHNSSSRRYRNPPPPPPPEKTLARAQIIDNKNLQQQPTGRTLSDPSAAATGRS